MRKFIREWLTGFRILLFVGSLTGLTLLAGAMAGVLLFGLIIELPAELIFKAHPIDSYGYMVAFAGAAIWGIQGLGRCKAMFIEAIDGGGDR